MISSHLCLATLSLLVLLSGALAASYGCAGDCVPRWSQCSGDFESPDDMGSYGYTLPCCEGSDHCLVKNEYYAQCRPKDMPAPEGWTTDVDDCDPEFEQEDSVGCSEECAPAFAPCAGEGMDIMSCCDADYQCVQKNEFFASCKPKDREMPEGAVVLTC